MGSAAGLALREASPCAGAAGGACAFRKLNPLEEGNKMTNETKMTKISRFTRILGLAAIAMLGVATLTPAQELVKAKFTLTAETRFGATVLPAGQYTLFIEPINSIRAVGSPVAITVRSENGSGPYLAVL